MKIIEYDEAALDVLTSVAESLVTTGMYKSPQEAVKGLALAQIERDIASSQASVHLSPPSRGEHGEIRRDLSAFGVSAVNTQHVNK